MKLYIESSAIFSERSGIGQFSKRLVEKYHEKYPEDNLRLFGFKFISREFHPPITPDSALKYRLIRWLPGRIYTGLFKKGIPIPIDVLTGAKSKDIFLYPNFVRWPSLYNKNAIAIIHDLSFELYGQYSSPANREYMQKYVPDTIKKSRHIIAISNSTKNDLIKYYDVPENQISIVHCFADSIFYRRSKTEISQVKKKYKIKNKYILFVSSLEPRKNILGILNAYEKLDAKIHSEYALVLAGGKGWLNETIHSKADEMVEAGLSVIRTGYVPDEDLPALYSGSDLFLFPSFYEGFGIPPLEAMACGVPVITSNCSSLPEVVGDAAVLVAPENVDEITKAVIKVLTNPKLSKQLIDKGYRQIEKYSPEKSADQLHSVIEKIKNDK